MRLLVLGAGGFIGRHVREAAEIEPDVALVAHARSPRGSGPGAWVALDLLEASLVDLRDFVADVRPTVIVNCTGALTGDERELVAVNVEIVERLLRAARTVAPSSRLVQMGSAAEYGPVPRGQQVAEDAATRPTGDYGRTKLAATRLVVAARDAGTDAIVLRAFNPVGSGMSRATLPGRAARVFAEAIEHGIATVEFGALDTWRDFVDARDVAAAVLAAARATAPLPPVVNVGSGSAVMARALVRELAAIAGYRGRVVEAGATSPRSTEVSWQAASIELAMRTLGWRPRHTLRDALERLWSGTVAGG
jgi:NDP-hexose 4-ketoreductase